MAIFKKEEGMPVQATAPTIGDARSNQKRQVSVIGPTLVIKGELSADEDLVIDGQIEGTIAHHEKNLTVGKQGRVKADIHARSVIVLGQLVGDIHSEGMVTLAKDANVVGDIYCGRIVMEDGARFRGKIEMGEKPKVAAVSTKPESTGALPKKKKAAAEG